MIFVLEGNVAAGKSLFALTLCAFLKKGGFKVIHIEEPVNSWTNFFGDNLLKLYYEDMSRWAFTFQINAAISTTENELKAIQLSKEGYVVVMERSTFSVFELFSSLLKESVFHSVETNLIDRVKKVMPSVLDKFKNNVVVLYIKTQPNICFKRMLERSRFEELGNIDVTYFERLYNIHEENLVVEKIKSRLLIVDGSSYSETSIEESKLFQEDSSVFEALIRCIKDWQDASGQLFTARS